MNRRERAPRESATRPSAEVARLLKADSHLSFLRESLRGALSLYQSAKNGESYVAAEKALRSAVDIRASIEALEKAAREATGPLSEEEFLLRFDEHVEALPEAYLERAVQAYIARHPGIHITAAEGIQ